MLSKIFSLLILIAWVYILAIFFAPSIADQYGNSSLNTKIRHIKDASLLLSSGATENPQSIIDTLKNNGESILTETKQTIDTTKKVAEEKLEQAKQAKQSAEDAYNALEKAKSDLQKLTNLSGSTAP